MAATTRYQQAMERIESCRSERDEYMDDWRDSADFVLGLRSSYLEERTHRNKRERNPNLLNETGLESAEVLASGMMAGITSPARPWFKLALPDPDMAEFSSIKEWLNSVERILYAVFSRSNFYRSMHDMYFSMGLFGNMATGLYQDFNNVLRCENYPVGSYMLRKDGKRDVVGLYREYSITVGEAVSRFGYNNLSKTVQKLYDNNSVNSDVPIIHMIEPNENRNPSSPLSANMAYSSVYWEPESGKGYDPDPLAEMGFNTKPFIAPRWSISGEETYPTRYPAINSMGSNKALQAEELDMAIAIEKMHNPPMVVDAALENNGVDLIAGGVTYVPDMARNGKPSVQSAYDITFRVGELNQVMKEKEARIQRMFYSDLFLMLSNMDRAQITATEIIERKEEKLLMLGPVLQRLNNEALDPIIDRTFEICNRVGIIPPPPPELPAGMQIKVEYVSVLAQAQKAIATSATQATAAFIGNLAQLDPSAIDKLNVDEAIEEYAEAKGAAPNIVRGEDEVAEIRARRAEAQAAAEQNARAVGMADTAKTLSETETPQGNALDAVSQALSGL